jgi:branched-chain amino acid transport system substrate-binding protein
MRKKLIVLLLILALILSLSALGCRREAAEEGEEQPVAEEEEKEPYKIGVVLSATGPSAPLGEPEKNTLLLEVEKIEKAGGVDGHPLEVIIEDDQTDPAKAVDAVTKLIEQDNVLAIIGGSTSPSTLAIMEKTSKAEVPQMAMAAGIPITSPINEWVFRTPPSDAIAVAKVLEYLTTGLKVKKIAILHDSNAFGTSGATEIQSKGPAKGFTVVAVEKYNTTDADLTAQLTKIKGTDAEALVVWGTNPGPAVAAKNMKQLGMTIPYVGSHGIANTRFIELGGEAANGVVFPAGKILIPESIENRAQKKVTDTLIEEYSAKYGKNPDTFAGHAWDGLYMLVNALKKSGADKAKLRDEVEKTKNFAGIGGIFSYSPTNHDGLATKDMIMIRIENGKWTEAK